MSPAVATSAPAYSNYSPALRKLLDDYIDAHASEPGQVIIFKQLYSAQKQEALNDGDVAVPFVSSPRRLRLLRTVSILDPGTGRPITIANLAGWAPNGQTGRDEPIIPEVVFEASNDNQLYVTAADPVLLERLLLDPKNKDNINPRSAGVVPDGGYLYEMAKPAASAASQYKREKEITAAKTAIETLEDDRDQLLSVVGKLDIPTVDRGRTRTDEELLNALNEIAKVEPLRVTNLMNAGEAKLEQLIAKAEKLSLIDFVEDVQQWRWKATQEPICEAVQGYKPQFALVRFIQVNAKGPGFSQMLAGRVKQEEKKVADAEKKK